MYNFNLREEDNRLTGLSIPRTPFPIAAGLCLFLPAEHMPLKLSWELSQDGNVLLWFDFQTAAACAVVLGTALTLPHAGVREPLQRPRS